MSEKIRDDFESWCRGIGFTLKMNAWGNDYAIGYGWEQWQAWQASRAAMVVELPEKAALMSASSVYAALDDAGVGYK